MSTTTLRHARPRPKLAAKVTPMIASRTNLVTGGAILSLPAMATSLVAASPALAAGSGAQAVATPRTFTATPSANVVRLSYGSTGSLVKVLQQRLGGLTTDGVFGPLTLAKVKAFQGSHGLVVDGIVGPLTWAALGGFPSGGGTVSNPPTGGTTLTSCTVTTLGYGSSGTLVRVLQQRLGGLTADGDFGPLTLASVRRFQSNHALAVTGVADAATWRALGGYPCSSTNQPIAGGGSGSSSGGSSSSSAVAAVVAKAKQYLGVPYVWGGSSPSGFDCSGLTSYVYRQLGMSIPRTASAQQAALTPTNNPVPGDLVFFGYPAYHVGIYVSPGVMIAAPHPGTDVQIESIWTTPTGYGHYTG